MTRHHAMLCQIPEITNAECEERLQEALDRMHKKYPSRLVAEAMHRLINTKDRLERLQLSLRTATTALIVVATILVYEWITEKEKNKVLIGEDFGEMLHDFTEFTLDYIQVLGMKELADHQDYVDAEIESEGAVKH